MTFLDCEIHDLEQYTRKDRRAAYETWRDVSCPNREKFPFEYGKEKIKEVLRTWFVTSFGDYRDASGDSRRFISYRNSLGSMTLVFQWRWDSINECWTGPTEQRFGSW